MATKYTKFRLVLLLEDVEKVNGIGKLSVYKAVEVSGDYIPCHRLAFSFLSRTLNLKLKGPIPPSRLLVSLFTFFNDADVCPLLPLTAGGALYLNKFVVVFEFFWKVSFKSA